MNKPTVVITNSAPFTGRAAVALGTLGGASYTAYTDPEARATIFTDLPYTTAAARLVRRLTTRD
jgi:hypothetical protein